MRTEAPAQSTAPPPRTGPCWYISEAEASEILGQPSVYRQARTPGTCNIGPSDGSANPQLSLVISIDSDTASYNNYVSREDAAIIAGIGERAVWTSGNTLVSVKGDKRLLMTLSDSHRPSTVTELDLQQKAATIAEKILNKM
jgi:hypothetical protein